MAGAARRWSIWIDTGGTFTDCVARTPDGELRRAKVLSSGAVRGRVATVVDAKTLDVVLPWHLPDGFLDGWSARLLGGSTGERIERHEGERSRLTLAAPLHVAAGVELELRGRDEAAAVAARLVTGTPSGRPLPPIDLRLATTRGTNALLERRGAPVALFVTRGFGDLLEIGNQQRPDLFALAIHKPRPLYRRVVEVAERLAADGSVLEPLDLAPLESIARELLGSGVRVAAVALMHAYRNPDHERRLAGFLAEAGFEHVSGSAALAPLIRYVPRAETAVVDAYLAPAIGDYVAAVRSSLGLGGEGGRLTLMTSAGGLVGADHFRPKDSLLSGPAGGVVGAAGAGRASGFERVIAFDMGGTSTDVSRFDGEFDYRFETRVGDAHLMAPALAIETVAAGGGSVCAFEGGRLRVGPQSAGADPGPACYGAGGPLTLTDVNLLLGRLQADRFEIPIDVGASERRLAQVLDATRAAGERDLDAESLLAGFLAIADERMAEAVRRISVREGYDPADYALVAFGGAGAQHGCALGRLLGVGTVLVPGDAGLLSAVGLGHAVVERFRERQILAPLTEVESSLHDWAEELADEAREAVAREGVERDEVVIRLRRVHLRLLGQDSALAVDLEPGTNLRPSFGHAYRAVYGYLPDDRPIEVESLRVVASTARSGWGAAGGSGPDAAAASGARVEPDVRAWFDGGWRSVPQLDRSALQIGTHLAGPCLIFERHSATVVDAGWSAAVDHAGALVLTREAGDV